MIILDKNQTNKPISFNSLPSKPDARKFKMMKNYEEHPTRKPISILTRIILASTKPNAWILDPFAGSGTTGIAANLLNRRFVGIDSEESYLMLSQAPQN